VNLVTIAEATTQSEYSHEHIKYLVRTGKIEGRKSGGVWLVDLDSLKAYEQKMKELGPQKFDPYRDNPTI
jgi:hypothetical protein